MRQIEKHSSIANKIPSVNVLADGEIALNTNDSKIFIKRDDGVLVEHNEWEPKLYEVQDLAARDALTPKNGQYAFYTDTDSDKILDMWYEGSWVLIQKATPPPPRFLMHVTAPIEPTYRTTSGTLTTVDNNDGTWTISSFDAITKIESVSKADVEVVVEIALDLVDASYAWYDCSSLTSFDSSGLTSVTSVYRTWESCSTLISFDTSGLTNVTDAREAWTGCWELTSFDASVLTLATNITSAWYSCGKLTSFDASGLVSVTAANDAWQFCTFTPRPPINPSTGTNVWP